MVLKIFFAKLLLIVLSSFFSQLLSD